MGVSFSAFLLWQFEDPQPTVFPGPRADGIQSLLDRDGQDAEDGGALLHEFQGVFTVRLRVASILIGPAPMSCSAAKCIEIKHISPTLHFPSRESFPC